MEEDVWKRMDGKDFWVDSVSDVMAGISICKGRTFPLQKSFPKSVS
jgi:hypothetical protein